METEDYVLLKEKDIEMRGTLETNHGETWPLSRWILCISQWPGKWDLWRQCRDEKRQKNSVVAAAGKQGLEVVSSVATIKQVEGQRRKRAKKRTGETQGVWKSNSPGKTAPSFASLP